MSLVTRCPKCQSGFEVTADQLRLHDGLVRCGQCSYVFDGYANLQASLPTLTRKVQEPSSAGVAAAAGPHVQQTGSAAGYRPGGGGPESQHTAARSDVVQQPEARPEPDLEPDPEPESAPEPRPFAFRRQQEDELETLATRFREPAIKLPLQDDGRRHEDDDDDVEVPIRVIGETRFRGDDPSATGRREPEFMETADESSLGSRLFWGALSVVLLLVMLLQLTLYFRNDIATVMPSSMPVLQTLCKPFDCEVHFVRRIDRIIIIGSSLQQVEPAQGQGSVRGVPYRLRLTLQNRNDHPQHWPSLLLTLNDASGTAVVRKVLSPSEYLPASLADKPFAARQEVAIELDLVVQGHDVSGFEVRRFFE